MPDHIGSSRIIKIGIVTDTSNSVNGLSTPTGLQDAKRTTWEVPVSFSWGDHAIYGTYTKAGATSGLVNTGAKQMNFVYDYALTKRAFIGVYYTKVENDTHAYYQPFLTGYSPFGGSAIAKGESWHQIGVILNYWF